jgi:hypothetical protein
MHRATAPPGTLTLRHSDIRIDIKSDEYEYELTVAPNMFLTTHTPAVEVITNLHRGANTIPSGERAFPINPEFEYAREEIPHEAKVCFTLYGKQHADSGETMMRHIGDAWLYLDDILLNNQTTFVLHMYDYPLRAEEELERADKATKKMPSDIKGTISFKLLNATELKQRFNPSNANTTTSMVVAHMQERFEAYINDSYIIYQMYKALYDKYKSFIVPFYVRPEAGGLMGPSALVLTLQQFVGTVNERLYFNNLLAAMWRMDMLPVEFLRGAEDSAMVNGMHTSRYVRSVQAALNMISVAINVFPYAGDHTEEGQTGVDIDYPEMAVLVKAWDCEDGSMLAYRLIMMLVRMKNMWGSIFVRTAAELLDRHYRPAAGKLVCAGDVSTPKVNTQRQELCHLLCNMPKKEYYRKLFKLDGHLSETERMVIDWPEWMYYSESSPPPRCKLELMTSKYWRRQEQELLSIEPINPFSHDHVLIEMPAIATLESTALSNVYPTFSDGYPGGVEFWDQPRFDRLEKMHNYINQHKIPDSFMICPDMPSISTRAQVKASPTTHDMSLFYNAFMSIAVPHPHMMRKLDLALGRENMPQDITYHPETFTDLVFFTEERYGAFYSELVVESERIKFMYKAYLEEEICDLGVKCFMMDRSVLFPHVSKQLKLPFPISKFEEMAKQRDYTYFILVPKEQHGAVALDLETLEHTVFACPETGQKFRSKMMKLRYVEY